MLLPTIECTGTETNNSLHFQFQPLYGVDYYTFSWESAVVAVEFGRRMPLPIFGCLDKIRTAAAAAAAAVSITITAGTYLGKYLYHKYKRLLFIVLARYPASCSDPGHLAHQQQLYSRGIFAFSRHREGGLSAKSSANIEVGWCSSLYVWGYRKFSSIIMLQVLSTASLSWPLLLIPCCRWFVGNVALLFRPSRAQSPSNCTGRLAN